ncbi:MAG: hypothetical protein IH845_05355 [Nanoarchaeota archaeon]|nr:hypothetical protein [Nanoarchaeota archaeon]
MKQEQTLKEEWESEPRWEYESEHPDHPRWVDKRKERDWVEIFCHLLLTPGYIGILFAFIWFITGSNIFQGQVAG